MDRIGIIYSSSTGNTGVVAEEIARQMRPESADVFDLLKNDISVIKKYKNLIFGVPTWNSSALHEDWDEIVKKIKNLDLREKTIALFGLGDQEGFPDCFVDSLGVLYQELKDTGCKFAGLWPAKEYQFTRSEALINGVFAGLVLDEDSQPHLTSERIKEWTRQLKKEFC